MARPLSFLAPHIGEARALNPLGLGDDGRADAVRGRGALKPAGKAMALLKPVLALENKLQASVLGVDNEARRTARAEIERTVRESPVVIYTYGLSPFSSEARALLEAAGADFKEVQLGQEWFLLGKESSATRAELLEMTGQSSLPHVFIRGRHVGGLFSGPAEVAGGRGLAGLQEAGELPGLLQEMATPL